MRIEQFIFAFMCSVLSVLFVMGAVRTIAELIGWYRFQRAYLKRIEEQKKKAEQTAAVLNALKIFCDENNFTMYIPKNLDDQLQ